MNGLVGCLTSAHDDNLPEHRGSIADTNEAVLHQRWALGGSGRATTVQASDRGIRAVTGIPVFSHTVMRGMKAAKKAQAAQPAATICV